MNKKDKSNSQKLSKEDISDLAKFFGLLMKMDKKQNPHLYRSPKDGTVLDKDGNEVKL